MPTVTVEKDRLFNALHRPQMEIAEFEEICFDFGVELDDVTSEREIAAREHGGHENLALSDKIILKIDVSANRYDLLCEEGLTRALSIFLGLEVYPVYKVTQAQASTWITVKKNTGQIRPFIVGAVLRNVTLDEIAYDSFIELQDKLHQGLCRRRSKVAIGTHDLDCVSGPITYDALPPSEISFVPLNQTQKMNGTQLMEHYESDKRLSKFLHIIRDSPVYPVVKDSKGTVLSLPPIINGDTTKIIPNKTKNIFIECTATEESKAKTVLQMIVAMFSQYCHDKFSIEQVQVFYEETGKTFTYPDMTPRQMKATTSYINSCINSSPSFRIPSETMITYLQKMGLSAKCTIESNEETLVVDVPVTRSDILHACDIMEDVAVAYGINNIPKTVPATSTVASAFPLNKLSDLVRREVAFAGWTEVLPLTLCSHAENFEFLRKVDKGGDAVELLNPATAEYQVVRNSLMPGILKTACANKKSGIPWKLFEVGDIVLPDPLHTRRARNERHLCAFYANKTSGFELIHGLIDRVLGMLGVRCSNGGDGMQVVDKDVYYEIRESDLPSFFPGRQAEIIFKGKAVGHFGIVHPEVLEKFEIGYPCSLVEINLEPFL